ncbi:hypothetical protein Dimus_017104 [Dionaea muscipula]
MVTDAELVERLREYLESSDLKKTTNASLRRQLEQDFGIDLSERKVFLRKQVDVFLQSQPETSEEYYAADREANSHDDGGGDETSSSDEEEDGDSAVVVGERVDEAAAAARWSIKRRARRGTGRYHKLNKEPNKTVNGFTKLFALSPQLQKFLGVSEMSQPKVLQQIWTYIRDRNLHDPKDKKNIICDDLLRPVFGADSIDMFEINKALSKHLSPLDAAPTKAIRRARQRKKQREEDPDEVQSLGKQQRKRYSGFLAPAPLSEPLTKFLGTGESELTRAVVITRIWDYIKDNNLQDPSDMRTVLCDEKLKELFGVDSFRGFTVSKLLSAHLKRT